MMLKLIKEVGLLWAIRLWLADCIDDVVLWLIRLMVDLDGTKGRTITYKKPENK